MLKFGLRSAALVGAGGAFVAGLASSASGTVLTFNMGASDGQLVSDLYQAYGDRVGDPIFDAANPQYTYGAGGGLTPNVQVVYENLIRFGSSQAPSRRFGDMTNVLYRQPGGSNTLLEVGLYADDFGPALSCMVQLFSFDVAAVLSENLPLRSLKVLTGSGTVLFMDPMPGQPTPIVPAVDAGGAPTHKTYDFVALLGGPITANSIRIVLDVGQISSKIDRYGLDNIKFGQICVPTPGAAGLLLGAMGVLAARRRRG